MALGNYSKIRTLENVILISNPYIIVMASRKKTSNWTVEKLKTTCIPVAHAYSTTNYGKLPPNVTFQNYEMPGDGTSHLWQEATFSPITAKLIPESLPSPHLYFTSILTSCIHFLAAGFLPRPLPWGKKTQEYNGRSTFYSTISQKTQPFTPFFIILVKIA